MLTRDDIVKVREECLAERAKLLASLNKADGGITICDEMLRRWDAPEAPVEEPQA